MTPDQFKAWRTRMGFSQARAAEALDISRSSVVNYEAGERRVDGRPAPIPKAIELACAALEYYPMLVLRAIGVIAAQREAVSVPRGDMLRLLGVENPSGGDQFNEALVILFGAGLIQEGDLRGGLALTERGARTISSLTLGRPADSPKP